MRHEIVEVLPDSIAEELGIEPGDFLLKINECVVSDILDYEFAVQSEELLLEIEKNISEGDAPFDPMTNKTTNKSSTPAPHSDTASASSPEIWELEIEKDAEEELGLVFKNPLLSSKRKCRNRCIFCFVDQQPTGLRKSLYFKDDDIRLSFLHGNYVTLTNVSRAEVDRIAGFHLSPLRISVHAANVDLRKKMMGCDAADNLFDALKAFGNAGISMHFQIVLCRGINDGEHLAHTIAALARIKGAESLAVVPAGITRHRSGLFPLAPFTPAEAREVFAQIETAQAACRRTMAKPFVFAADEWYIMANVPFPSHDMYEDFPQLDNGVGTCRLFENEFLEEKLQAQENLQDEKDSGDLPQNAHELCEKSSTKTNIGIITGKAAEGFMHGLADAFEAAQCVTRPSASLSPYHEANSRDADNPCPAKKITIHAIENNFFGENITVSGLLTGADIIAQLKNHITADVLFVPQNAFRAGTEVMLDGITRAELSAALGIPVEIGSTHGGEFYEQLCSI